LFARSVVALVAIGWIASAGCVRNSQVGDLRGFGRGWVVAVTPAPDPSLTQAGAAVAVIDATTARGCRPLGYVSGAATRRGIRPANADREQLIASVSREGAVTDARNRAGAHGATAIVVDADETWETGRAVRYLVHGRALRCR